MLYKSTNITGGPHPVVLLELLDAQILWDAQVGRTWLQSGDLGSVAQLETSAVPVVRLFVRCLPVQIYYIYIYIFGYIDICKYEYIINLNCNLLYIYMYVCNIQYMFLI